MMVLDARARARSTHLGIGDDVLRNVGRALAQTHARTHGEFGFGFGIERAIDRMNASRCVESSRSDACAGMGWDALDSCVRARTHSSTRMVTMTDIGRTCGRAFERDVVVRGRGRGRGREVRTRVAGTASGRTLESESARVVYATSRALDHACEGHPESNARVPAIEEALTRNGLTPETREGNWGRLSGSLAATTSAGGGAREELRARVGVGVREERADAFGQCADVLHRVELSRRHVRGGAATALVDEVIAREGRRRRAERVWVDSTAGTSRGAERSDGVLSGRYGRGGGETRAKEGVSKDSHL